MRIWSILLIEFDLKWCIHLSRSLFSYLHHDCVATFICTSRQSHYLTIVLTWNCCKLHANNRSSVSPGIWIQLGIYLEFVTVPMESTIYLTSLAPHGLPHRIFFDVNFIHWCIFNDCDTKCLCREELSCLTYLSVLANMTA